MLVVKIFFAINSILERYYTRICMHILRCEHIRNITDTVYFTGPRNTYNRTPFPFT